MIRIDDTLVSEDLKDVRFVCDLHACKGACCIEGDAGAPLEEGERAILDKIYPIVKPYLSETSQAVIAEKGTWVEEEEDDFATPLINGKECAYVVFDNETAFCGIEQAHRDGKIDWPKPISCHLYPVRISDLLLMDVEAVNYEEWDICKPACTLGKSLKMPVYKFLKVPLTRKFGEAYYQKMCDIFEAMDERRG